MKKTYMKEPVAVPNIKLILNKYYLHWSIISRYYRLCSSKLFLIALS